MDQVFKSEDQFQGHKCYICKSLTIVNYCNLHNKLKAKHLYFQCREKQGFLSSFEVSIAEEFDDKKIRTTGIKNKVSTNEGPN